MLAAGVPDRLLAADTGGHLHGVLLGEQGQRLCMLLASSGSFQVQGLGMMLQPLVFLSRPTVVYILYMVVVVLPGSGTDR